MEGLPQDPILCLSVVNTRLRDVYASLDALCEDLNVQKDSLIAKLAEVDYLYDEGQNQFI